jgi:hypothetical protein
MTRGRQFVLNRILPGIVIGYGFYVCDDALERGMLGDPKLDCNNIPSKWANRSYIEDICRAHDRIRNPEQSSSVIVLLQACIA